MRRIETDIVIDRPVEEVFEFVSNPENDTSWQSGLEESRLTSEGPMGVGSTHLVVRRFLGKRIESLSEVTRFEPNAKIGLNSLSPPGQFAVEYTFEPINGGTRITTVAQADSGGLFKLGEPLVMKMVEAEMRRDFAALKELLEARSS